MAQEIEPARPSTPAPRGCVLAFLLAVVLALAALVVLVLAMQPRFPGADPF